MPSEAEQERIWLEGGSEADWLEGRGPHTGRGPLHVCDVAGCEAGFATLGEVTEHERTHRGRESDGSE